ncbi:MAG: hypothetical protein MO852_08130, partial [Candidatus Devosia euplotis]|nr:hypothetical protein [Candidatus Devosia euplotis]
PGWTGVAASMVVAMIAVGFLGATVQRAACQPTLNAPRLSILITALAVSLVLQNGLLSSPMASISPWEPISALAASIRACCLLAITR